MLLGSVGQLSTSRYGLGNWVCFGYWVCWACATSPNVAIPASTAISMNLVRPASIIANLSGYFHLAAESPRTGRRAKSAGIRPGTLIHPNPSPVNPAKRSGIDARARLAYVLRAGGIEIVNSDFFNAR